jgi:hypothetical protein
MTEWSNALGERQAVSLPFALRVGTQWGGKGMDNVFEPRGAYAMAQKAATDWCEDHAGIEPVIADLFAV